MNVYFPKWFNTHGLACVRLFRVMWQFRSDITVQVQDEMFIFVALQLVSAGTAGTAGLNSSALYILTAICKDFKFAFNGFGKFHSRFRGRLDFWRLVNTPLLIAMVAKSHAWLRSLIFVIFPSFCVKYIRNILNLSSYCRYKLHMNTLLM